MRDTHYTLHRFLKVGKYDNKTNLSFSSKGNCKISKANITIDHTSRPVHQYTNIVPPVDQYSGSIGLVSRP